jgi:hypothetical protein
MAHTLYSPTRIESLVNEAHGTFIRDEEQMLEGGIGGSKGRQAADVFWGGWLRRSGRKSRVPYPQPNNPKLELVGERWIRHQRRRKAVVTMLWCLALSIAFIAIAFLVPLT